MPYPGMDDGLRQRKSCLTGNMLLDRITHHVHILEMNGESIPTQAKYGPACVSATVNE